MLFAQRKPNSVMKHLDRLNAKKKTVNDGSGLVCSLCCLKDGKIEDGEIREAVEIVHTRRFSAVDLLQDYYKNVDLFLKKISHMSCSIYPVKLKLI